MNKDRVRSKLIELASAELDGARAAYAEHLQASKPEEDQATEVDDQSQAWSQAELAEGLEKMLHAAKARVAAAELEATPRMQWADKPQDLRERMGAQEALILTAPADELDRDGLLGGIEP